MASRTAAGLSTLTRLLTSFWLRRLCKGKRGSDSKGIIGPPPSSGKRFVRPTRSPSQIGEPADKPGSVPGSARGRCPRQPFLLAGGRPPAPATYPQARPSRPRTPAYLVLLRMEVAAFHPRRIPRAACASRRPASRSVCETLARRLRVAPSPAGLVSVALFVALPRRGVTPHPALRSPDFPLHRKVQRLPGRLPDAILSQCSVAPRVNEA